MRVPDFATKRVFLTRHLARTRQMLLGELEVDKESSSRGTRRSRLIGHPLVSRVAKGLIQLVLIISILVSGVVAVPWLYYTFAPVETVPVPAQTDGSALGGEFTAQAPRTVTQPPKDETLPEGSWISIPAIGVRTQLRPTEDPEEALRHGVWLAPEYGQPGATDEPMIVVAHRFGYKVWWQDDYWKYNSFYFLPQTQPGDLVEVIHDQRKWVYEIYAGEEGEEITDYAADMILYTCKYLNSPIRHFRYARLVDI